MSRFLFTILVVPALAMSQPLRWTTYTSTSNVVDLTVASGRIWSITTGGLSGLDPGTGLFDVYTNTRGLAMNNSLAGGRDSRGWVWIAHQNGVISRVNPETGATRIIDGLRGEVFEITSILDVGDEVFVSANNGIYRMSYQTVSDNYRILESIRDLGTFPGETRVSSLAAVGGYLYAATEVGLARASLTEPNLSAPHAWETFTVSDGGLPENDVRALFGGSDGVLWIATANRLARFDGSNFSEVSQTAGIVAFAEADDQLYAATAGNIWLIGDAGLTPVGPAITHITDLDEYDTPHGARLVVGVGDDYETPGGLRFLENDQWTPPLRADGIGSNLITALAVDPNGRLWGGGTDAVGFFVMDDQGVTNYLGTAQHSDWFFFHSVNSFAFDNYGGVWIGSEGGGAMWIHGDTLTPFNNLDTRGFDNTGARMTETVPGTNYIIAAVTRDHEGDIFITNTGTQNNHPLGQILDSWIARGNNSDPWLYYTPLPFSMEPSHRDVVKMVVDAANRVWIGGHDRNGTANWVFDDRGTPADTVGDRWFGFNPDTLKDPGTCFDQLGPQVTSWDIDQQGYLWVGTHSGAYYTQGGIPQDLRLLRFTCVYDLPVGQSVNAVYVDPYDNKWFGTDHGVAVMDKNFAWVHIFHPADADDHRSGLASDNVTSITSDPTTGDVWIGTMDGLSRLESPYVSRSSGYGDLRAYPNPFVADGSQHLFVNHQELGGQFDEFRVYTLSGRLVRKLPWDAMIDPLRGWDGRNDKGDLVAGGVYLLVVSSNDGNSATGKVAVLGK